MAQQRFYFDTSIFIDYYENRSDNFRPLGEWAFRLLMTIRNRGNVLLVSDAVFEELVQHYSKEKIDNMLQPFQDNIVEIKATMEQREEATKTAHERNLPRRDVLHAILTRDHSAVLIARDKHFELLTDITISRKPEELI